MINKQEFINIVQPISLTSPERISALFDSLEDMRINNTPGDIVECGVYKGGNIISV